MGRSGIEAAQSEAPEQAKEVIQAVIDNRLPIRMSSRTECSDSIGKGGRPTELSKEEKFKQVRAKAAQGQLVIIRPDGQYLRIPAPRKENAKADAIAAVERILPSTAKRNVAIIGDTAWTLADAPDLHGANEAIPFFGLLMGFASIGQSVWVFEGADDILEQGCRDADVLIADSASLTRLSSEWEGKAAQVMRNPQILVHDRASYQLRKVGMKP